MVFGVDVWNSCMRFLFGIHVLDTGLGLRFGVQVWIRLGIRVWDSGLRFWFEIQV